MKTKDALGLIACISVLFGCAQNQDDYSGYFCDPEFNLIELEIEELNLERLRPEVYGISYVGFSGIASDKLFFADRLFASLYQFSREGEFEEVMIRKGNGPHEIPVSRIESYCVSDVGHHFFLDSSTNLYEFDEEYNLVNKVFYYWSKKITKGQICEQTDSYCTCWGDNVNLTVNRGTMYTNVSGESDEFNILVPEYYKSARIIEPRDARTGDPFPLLGRISPAVKYMSAFQKDFFRITDEGDFVVAYEADDLIYVYDSKYRLKYSFGQPGMEMNKDYVTLTEIDFQERLSQELETKGRYTSLCLVKDLTFRTYVTGRPADETRLQIYRGTTLIGDVPVPSGFKMMGFIEPYFYSEFICDENEETLDIYRFKL